MALREILKIDTSPQAQAAQSAACNAEADSSDTAKNVEESESASSLQTDNETTGGQQCPEAENTESNIPSVQDVEKMEVSDAT